MIQFDHVIIIPCPWRGEVYVLVVEISGIFKFIRDFWTEAENQFFTGHLAVFTVEFLKISHLLPVRKSRSTTTIYTKAKFRGTIWTPGTLIIYSAFPQIVGIVTSTLCRGLWRVTHGNSCAESLYTVIACHWGRSTALLSSRFKKQ